MLVLLSFALTACGGGGSSGTTPQQGNPALPAPGGSAITAGKKVAVSVTIRVPGSSSKSKSSTAAVRQSGVARKPKYLGSTDQSVADTLTFTPSDSTGVPSGGGGGSPIPVTIGSACTGASASTLTCTVDLAIVPNTAMYWVVQAYDAAAPEGLAKPLSWGILTVDVVPNTANTASVNLLPVLAALSLSTASVNTSVSNGNTYPLTITPLDELSNVIVDTNPGDTFIDAAGNATPITVTGTGSGVTLLGVDTATLGTSFPDASSSTADDLSVSSVASVVYDGTGDPRTISVGFSASDTTAPADTLVGLNNFTLTVFANAIGITPPATNPSGSLDNTVVLFGPGTGQPIVQTATFTVTSPNSGATISETDDCSTAALGGGAVATITPTGAGLANPTTFTVNQVTGGTCAINLHDTASSPAGATDTVLSTTNTIGVKAYKRAK
jgi:hypothetical protein